MDRDESETVGDIATINERPIARKSEACHRTPQLSFSIGRASKQINLICNKDINNFINACDVAQKTFRLDDEPTRSYLVQPMDV